MPQIAEGPLEARTSVFQKHIAFISQRTSYNVFPVQDEYCILN